MSSTPPEQGARLAHFRLMEKLGEGGMGVVYKAWDTRLERVVALKLLPRDFLRGEHSRARLLREARIASSLNHPNIATIYGLEEANGQDVIAMEYIQGVTLAHRLHEGPLEVRRALEIAVAIADALGEAHGNGVVHRDIKPENIILTHRGHPKVMDFGLAKLMPEQVRDTGSATTKLTAEGVAMGTVAYMSPEQAVGKETDARTDVFSFGLILYEMLTREAAFSGDSDVDILYEIIHHKPRPVSELNPNVPADLLAVVDRCTTKDVEDRYADGKALCEDLQLARTNLDIQRERTLDTLLHISREMTSILDLEPLLERVATLVRSLIDYDVLGIFRLEERTRRLEWLGGVGYDPERARQREYSSEEGLCGRAIQQREPILVGDVRRDADYYPPNGEAYLSNLVVPLFHKDRVTGVLNMESRHPFFFTNDHLTIMSTLAGPIAVAIENAQLFEDSRRHGLAMEMLHEIGREIASILDLDFLLDRVGELTRKVIDFELFGIFLLDEERGCFTWRSSIGYDPEFVREQEIRLGEGVISRAVERREAILVDDVLKDPDHILVKTLDGRSPRSELAVPLTVQDRAFGAITLESVEPGHFRPEQAALMTVLASQVAVSIENARLYREVRERARSHEVEAERSRQHFESYVTPHVAEQVFRDPNSKMLTGERRSVTVLVADIRGFTAVAETLPGEETVRFLREFFSVMTHVIFKFEGTIDKFMGDSLMAFYGAPIPHDPRYGPSDPQRAVFAALDMRDAFGRLRDKWWEKHHEIGALELSVGINTGTCLLGNMGSEKRVEYTAIGTAVNEAFRLCRESKKGEIRIGGRTYQDVHEDVQVEPLEEAGVEPERKIHTVVGLKYFV
jgi:serine/threonine protein kinase/class 3 adenylate cyclase